MKLKLNPSARTKKRYLLIDGTKEEIERAILEYLGILGWAKAEPRFVGGKSGGVILAISRKELDNVKAALELSPKEMQILKVSGTLKGLKK